MRQPNSALYLTIFCVVTLIGLTAVTAINLTVDPYLAYRVVDLPELTPYRAELGSRTAKAEALRHGPANGEDWDGAIFGLSRSEFSIDPEHPAFGAAAVYNASLLGCDWYELESAFNLAADANDLDFVVIFAEFYMFNANERGHGDFEKSRFNPSRLIPVYHIENLTSLNALSASVDTVLRFRSKRPSEYTERGYRPRELAIQRWNHRARFEHELSRFLKRGSTYRTYLYSPERVERLAAMLERCRARGIRAIVIMSPTHTTHLEAIRATGLWETYETWKRDLVRVVEADAASNPDESAVPLWDFAGYTSYRAEEIADGDDPSSMVWWWENSHYRRSIGDRILDTVFGFESERPTLPEFGVQLDSESIEAHLERTRADRASYLVEHADQAAWVSELSERLLRVTRTVGRLKEW
ncbi:MAG: hypothetical protein ACF8PN_06710 [Phycisphaerales bacterium]